MHVSVTGSNMLSVSKGRKILRKVLKAQAKFES